MGYMEISSKEARRFYKKGTTVIMSASRVDPADKVECKEMPKGVIKSSDWDIMEDYFKWYNCNEKCGTGVRYYLKIH